jgi:hypothetical protein
VKPWQRRALYALGMLWTLPNTLIGLVAGIAMLPFGARPKLHPGELCVVFHGVRLGPGGAMTLGNVMLNTHRDLESRCRTYATRAGWCEEPLVRIGDHERAHVLQYMALGPLFLPLYFLHGGVSPKNRFERAADRYALAERDWWPWAAANARPALTAKPR